MSRISVIALEQLPPMAVLETISTEAIMDARMARLVELWSENDPPAGAVYDVETTEFDPLKINQQASTYFELMLRDRVNQAARAVTLAFAIGSDLDAIASRYPGGVPRLSGETDDRYRRRIWLSANLESPHGTFEAYVFWALTADPTLRDASATTVRGTGKITVTCMAAGASPTPTTAQLGAVLSYINNEARRGLTDIVMVAPPRITTTKYRIRVWLYPGFEQTAVMASINASIAALIEKQRWIGYDHTRMAIDAALAKPGVYNAVIDEPASDVIVGDNGLAVVTETQITMAGRGE